jgi:hypothetical protein
MDIDVNFFTSEAGSPMPMGELDLLVRAAKIYRVPLNAVSNRTFVQLTRGGGVSSDINRVIINPSCDICGEKKKKIQAANIICDTMLPSQLRELKGAKKKGLRMLQSRESYA